MKIKTTAPLFRRAVVFLCLFVLFSGIIGPKIISGGIVDRDFFGWYGSFGKVLLFAAIAFGLLVRGKQADIKPRMLTRASTVCGMLAVTSLLFAVAVVDKLINYGHQAGWIAAAHAGIATSVSLLAIACFGLHTIADTFRVYRRELLGAAVAGLGFFVLLEAAYASWELLAGIVLCSVRWLLDLVGLTAAIIPPRTLLLDRFGVTIAEYCSGVESLALFGGLYAVIGFLDWQKLNHRRFLAILPLALLLLFGLNILRIFALIVAGYYINPEIAFSLFHTYAGMIFFIIYAAIFWRLSYRWMLRKDV